MSTIEKWGTAIIGVAMVTTLILPKRQTPAVMKSFGNMVSKILGTAMGTAKPI